MLENLLGEVIDLRPVTVTLPTAALKQAMKDYGDFTLQFVSRNELHVWVQRDRLVFPGVGGHVEIHGIMQDEPRYFAIGDHSDFARKVRLLTGPVTTLHYRPGHERLQISCEGARFTVYAFNVELKNVMTVKEFVTVHELDTDIVARLKRAYRFAVVDQTRPTLEYVMYNRTFDIIAASDGFQLIIDNVARIDEAAAAGHEDPMFMRVHRSVLKSAQPGEKIALSADMACLIRRNNVYTYTNTYVESSFSFANILHIYHSGGLKYERFAVRSKPMLGLLDRFRRIGGIPHLLIAADSKNIVLLQPFTDETHYLNYVSMQQPDDLPLLALWSMPDNWQKLSNPPEARQGSRYACAVNSVLLSNALRALGGDVILAQANSTRPLYVYNPETPNVVCIIMPMNFTDSMNKDGHYSATRHAWRLLDEEVPYGEF